MLSAERLEELFKLNGIDKDKIIKLSPEMTEDMFDTDEEELKWSEDDVWDYWLESLFWGGDDHNWKELLDKGSKRKELDDLSDGEFDAENNVTLKAAFDEWFEDNKNAMLEEIADNKAYSRDPMGYYGVSWSDFV